MKNINREIQYVEPYSPADEAGIVPGDTLISVNGEEPLDILEYRFLTAEYEVTLEIEKKNGRREIITIENDYEDLGIEFCEGLISEAQSCRNKCIFCFIDQLPKGMRETVYFKDDDTRLSFLQGNYVTLTNVSDEALDRMIRMRVSPINISVHTTNPELRVKMLGNRFAGNVYDRMKKLAENKIYMNTQIVLCPGYNDNTELDRTIKELSELIPYVQSLSVVPVGLTAHREGLCKIEPFTKESSKEVVRQVEEHQKRLLSEKGTRFVYLSDEFYINAGLEIPKAEEYEGFPQIENGVGLAASLIEEFDSAIEYVEEKEYSKKAAIVTGELAAELIKGLAEQVMKRAKGIEVEVYPVKNEFFGGGVNVAGLVCAQDILKTVKAATKYDKILIPDCMLRDGEDVFLDNITLTELEEKLGVQVVPVPNDGYAFVEALIGEEIKL